MECIGDSFEARPLMRIGRTRVGFKKNPTTLDLDVICRAGWDAVISFLNMDIGNWQAPSGKLFLCKRVNHNLREAKLLCKNDEILEFHRNSRPML